MMNLKDRWLEQGLAKLFCKGLDIKILGFVDHAVSVTVIQLCHYSVKVAIDSI